MLVEITGFSEEESIQKIRECQPYKDQNFGEEWHKRAAEMEYITQCAKIYILDNYKEVKDWMPLSIRQLHSANNKPIYVRMKDAERDRRKTLLPQSETPLTPSTTRRASNDRIIKIFKKLDKESVMVTTFDDCVYDYTDGDFSVKFNGKWYNWIRPNAIIEIANFIEKNI